MFVSNKIICFGHVTFPQFSEHAYINECFCWVLHISFWTSSARYRKLLLFSVSPFLRICVLAASRATTELSAWYIGLETFATTTQATFLASTLQQFPASFRGFWKYGPTGSPPIVLHFPAKLRRGWVNLLLIKGSPDACLVKSSVRMIQQRILINKQKLYINGLNTSKKTRTDYFHVLHNRITRASNPA